MELLEGEKILVKTNPHPLSFWPYYVFFIYYIIIGFYFTTYYENILNFVKSLVVLEELANIAVIFLWLLLIIAPAAIFSIVLISWRWLIVYSIIGILGLYLLISGKATLFQLQYMVIIIGFLGIVLTEVYRKSHEYYVTNYRIVARLGFLGLSEREIFYSKITEIFVKQGILGKVFNYGSLIPVTASGIGTGEDAAQVSVGGGITKSLPLAPKIGGGLVITGEKAVRVPRGRSSFILYGVPKPDEIKSIIDEQLKSAEPQHYLKRQVELLEKLIDKEEKQEESE